MYVESCIFPLFLLYRNALRSTNPVHVGSIFLLYYGYTRTDYVGRRYFIIISSEITNPLTSRSRTGGVPLVRVQIFPVRSIIKNIPRMRIKRVINIIASMLFKDRARTSGIIEMSDL